MAKKEGRPDNPSPSDKKPATGSLTSRLKKSWLGKNWSTIAILVAIIFVALFVRSYFGYSTSVSNGFAVSGGSDSYYHEHVINYVQSTGSHLVNDPLLNYPNGIRNERPPLYDWSVAVVGMLIAGITGGAISLTTATGYSLIFSTALWGSLTIIPLFLLTREAFGKRAGLLAAFLFALMPGAIERSVLTDADHDAMILFFVVFALYFLMMSLKSITGNKWVASWKQPGEIRKGLRSYVGLNQRSLIYSMLGAFCLATIAMIWTGYTYILIIILVYFLVQVIINRFRNVDSLGVLMSVGVMLLVAFAVIAPLYWQLSYWGQWYDIPFYLFLGSMVLGGIFVVTRDYPWTLVVPSVVILLLVGLAGLAIFMPNLFQAIISGQGYLVKNKLYSTIAEAQAPTFSNLVLSIGGVTFWFAIAGLVWAAIKIPKNPNPYYVFIVVWMGVSMYMAASAARFMFNATPAFALAAGWVFALLIGMLHFEEIPKLLSGFRSNKVAVLKRTLKPRYIAAILFIAFLVILPNAWGALDAGIPYNDKKTYDDQIYYALPDILHSSNYNVSNSSLWYLGAFSYSIPLPSQYYPAAWSWFSQQDSNLSDIQKPAYISWWDYGFEAEQLGDHPTVADDFQNGYQWAASFMLSQNETDAIALLNARLLDKGGVTSDVEALLLKNNMTQDQVNQLKDIINNPSKDVTLVQSNPDIYGPYDSSMDPQNAKYAAERVLLSSIGQENLVNLYHDLRKQSGYDIGYFAVDTRLFPFSATGSSIFYAPAKLGDYVIDPKSGAPTAFYQIYAVTSDGSYKEVGNVTSSDSVQGYVIVYTDAFYKTMMYRAFMGLSPADIGSSTQGLPGLSGSLSSYSGSYQGYNLTHFRMVYKTAYYNPYNSTDIANHTDAWTAISYDEAQSIKAQIAAGTKTGTVDDSAGDLESGVVFLQYYDGAIITGKATAPDGTALPGVYVTVLDQYGIPHDVVQTDANGDYSVIAPFGKVSVVYSTGTLNKATKIATELSTVNYTISYDQAMRQTDNYTFNGDVTLPVTTVKGVVFWDNDGNGRFTTGDQYIEGANVTLANSTAGFSQQTTTGSDGSYSLVGVSGATDTLNVTYQGHVVSSQSVTLSLNTAVTKNIAVAPSTISGVVKLSSGGVANGVSLTLSDQTTGTTQTTTTNSTGGYTFSKVLSGSYTVQPTDKNLTADSKDVTVTAGKAFTADLTISSATQVSGTLKVNGAVQSNANVVFQSDLGEVSTTTASDGSYTAVVPQGNYTAYSLVVIDGTDYVAMANLNANSGTATLDLTGSSAVVTSGTVSNGGTGVSGASVVFTASDGARVKTTTNSTGYYRVELPSGTYFVYAQGSSKSFWGSKDLTSSGTFDVALADSNYLTGTIWYDANGDGTLGSSEGLSNAVITITDFNDAAKKVTFVSGSSGAYNVSLPTSNGYIITVSKDGYNDRQDIYNPLDSSHQINYRMDPTERTVTGTVSNAGSSLSGITVQFLAADSAGTSTSATTDGSGAFNAKLKPGNYYMVIDQDVVAGVDTSKYQSNTTLTVQVGKDPAALSINATKRVQVTGSVALNGANGTVTFAGPETKTIDAASGFPLYLEAGDYSVYTVATNGSQTYANLTKVTVTEGAPSLGIALQSASKVTGTLSGPSGTVSATTPVSITSGSATLNVTANAGTFTTYLPDGTYQVKAEYHAQAKVNGTTKYVVYKADQPITVAGSNLRATITMAQTLDNATLAGSISGASGSVSWDFTAIDGTAMDSTGLSSGASSYSFQLAPGNYSVYAVSGSNVYLGVVDVRSQTTNTVNLVLVPGNTISGTVTYDNGGTSTPLVANLTFSDTASKTVSTDSSGGYSIVLPSGIYNVTTSGTVVEGGTDVTYSRSFDLNVTASATQNIVAQRQQIGKVALTWNSADEQTKNPGESVTYDVTITNTGNVDDTYALTSTSDSGWDVSFSDTTVTIPWGNSNSKIVQVTIKTPTDAKVTHSPIVIKAKSTTSTLASGSVSVDVSIVPTYAATIDLGSAELTNGTMYVYPVSVKNTGNADDTYNVTVTNAEALAASGWTATISGSDNLYENVTVAAGSSSTVNVVLTKNTASPETGVAVLMTATSANTTADASINLKKIDLQVPSGDLKVSGNGISMTAPALSIGTYVTAALVVLMLALLIVLRMNKGVFGRRRKR